ncbi:MAG: hypothetical protein KA766_15305 [Piscinibacter sp.]|uniref:hypothetical protein n=1 Tax=Piscinibacter sp. TaxID=1903157 RepID=UPI001B7A2B32|nr:hypothetical protein [Piscinibacter sp.]MBP5991369.1 hypothetical protein [Piscinibacter sp.]MBP6028671.1 hypothetical protein [Piscinibacter sp.]
MTKHWLPVGMPPSLAMPAPREPSRWQYVATLELQLSRLIEADPGAARSGLEMSRENAPELWKIAQQLPRQHWASALARSDQLTSLLPDPWRVSEVEAEPRSLRAMLEAVA